MDEKSISTLFLKDGWQSLCDKPTLRVLSGFVQTLCLVYHIGIVQPCICEIQTNSWKRKCVRILILVYLVFFMFFFLLRPLLSIAIKCELLHIKLECWMSDWVGTEIMVGCYVSRQGWEPKYANPWHCPSDTKCHLSGGEGARGGTGGEALETRHSWTHPHT